jgi:hypothetical protein
VCSKKVLVEYIVSQFSDISNQEKTKEYKGLPKKKKKRTPTLSKIFLFLMAAGSVNRRYCSRSFSPARTLLSKGRFDGVAFNHVVGDRSSQGVDRKRICFAGRNF